MVHNTGDKFVIEIGEVIERHGEPPLYKIAGFNALVFIEFCGKYLSFIEGDSHTFMYIQPLESSHIVSLNDYIIKGIKGEFYPCKPDIFEMTYERVD